MMVWILLAVAVALVLALSAYYASRPRDEGGAGWSAAERGPSWSAHSSSGRISETRGRISESRLTAVPPASGVPMAPTASEEGEAFWAESQELWAEDEPTGPVPRILSNAAAGSAPGRDRELNEDAVLLLPEHDLYAVADGMGGYAAGDVASALAVRTLRDAFERGELGSPREGFPRRGAELVATIERANERIREASRSSGDRTMGTTLVAARFSPGRSRAYIANVGDSRCYRIRDGRAELLTEDHTLGKAGLTGPEADKLSRAVGVFREVKVDLVLDEPEVGDHYLLCSDGLYKTVPENRIVTAVQAADSPQDAVAELLRVAKERGCPDDASLVLVRIEEPEVRREQSGEHRLPGR